MRSRSPRSVMAADETASVTKKIGTSSALVARRSMTAVSRSGLRMSFVAVQRRQPVDLGQRVERRRHPGRHEPEGVDDGVAHGVDLEAPHRTEVPDLVGPGGEVDVGELGGEATVELLGERREDVVAPEARLEVGDGRRRATGRSRSR